LKAGYQEYYEWESYSDQRTWVKFGDDCLVSDVVIADVLSPAEYTSMLAWKGAGACGGGTFSPVLTFEGAYELDIDGNLVFPFD